MGRAVPYLFFPFGLSIRVEMGGRGLRGLTASKERKHFLCFLVGWMRNERGEKS